MALKRGPSRRQWQVLGYSALMVLTMLVGAAAAAALVHVLRIDGELALGLPMLAGIAAWFGLYLWVKRRVLCPHCKQSLFDSYWGGGYDPISEGWHWGRRKQCPWCKTPLEDG